MASLPCEHSSRRRQRSRTERQARRTPAAELGRARGGPLVGCGLAHVAELPTACLRAVQAFLGALGDQRPLFLGKGKGEERMGLRRAKLGDDERTLCAIKPLMKCLSRLKRSSFEATHDHCSGSCGISASVRAPVLSLLAGSGLAPLQTRGPPRAGARHACRDGSVILQRALGSACCRRAVLEFLSSIQTPTDRPLPWRSHRAGARAAGSSWPWRRRQACRGCTCPPSWLADASTDSNAVSAGIRTGLCSRALARPETGAAFLGETGPLGERVFGGKATESQRLFRRRQETGIAQKCVVMRPINRASERARAT